MEIDHIYICTENKAPSGDLLVEFGLVEGSLNTHPGQCKSGYFIIDFCLHSKSTS